MKIVLIEAFFTGSHESWAKELQKYSSHDIEILSLSGQFWKWRMAGGAVTLAKMFQQSGLKPDLILTTDMLDLPLFSALTKESTAHIPLLIYFHENQLNYPWSDTDRDIKQNRDYHYVFKNYTSTLTADHVLFNSQYHYDSFLTELPKFLKRFPDYRELETVDSIRKKSRVLELGLDLRKFDQYKKPKPKTNTPLILWNHRWEYDKNPEGFFEVLKVIQQRGFDFQLAVLGEKYHKVPPVFEEARKCFHQKLVHFGYADSFADYAHWLWQADIIPVTNIQDFFGISIMEAVYCNTIPILPNRLTYPDLFDINTNKALFYQSNENLIDILSRLFQTYSDFDCSNLHTIAAEYDWSKKIQEYDLFFNEAAAGKTI